jgi:hypothetical protein
MSSFRIRPVSTATPLHRSPKNATASFPALVCSWIANIHQSPSRSLIGDRLASSDGFLKIVQRAPHLPDNIDQQIDRSRNSPADWCIRAKGPPGCGRIHEPRSWRASSTRTSSIQRRIRPQRKRPARDLTASFEAAVEGGELTGFKDRGLP